MKKLNPKNDEILGNSIKQITHQGGKKGGKKRTQVRTKRAEPRMDHKKAPKQIMSQSP
jgi:hypothetical protein